MSLAHRGSTFARWFTWALIFLAACFSLLLLSLRYWLLPDIERYRENIASAISDASGQYVTIGEISANWDGFRPHMMLGMIRVHDKEGNTTLLLHRLKGTLSWRSILHGNFHFREMEIERPDLVVRRDTKGVIHVAGFALDPKVTENENGFSDWLLRQRRVTINNASILWHDDLRAAPELELLVNLRLENHENHHRFGIRAIPAAGLAAQMDMRGDFTGDSLSVPEQWRGRLFVQIGHADIAAWYAWLPVPQQINLRRGIGALRMWVGIDGTDIKKMTADMRLQDVKAQLAENLPELDLTRLKGRVGWQKTNDEKSEGANWYARKLLTAIRGKRELEPVSFSLQIMPTHGEKAGSGKLSVDSLDLKILGDLAEYLPINQPLREQLSAVSPRGEIQSMRAHWNGEWSTPLHFNARGKFTNLSMRKSQYLPSFSGITGNMDVTEKGGSLNLNSEHIKLEVPDALHEPLMLNTLTGQASWSLSPDKSVAFKFSNIYFSNSHAAGLAYGTYHKEPNVPDKIDLVGHLTHADARYLADHIPSGIGGSSREWFEKSVLEGKFTDIRLHLKGNPAELPFSRDGTSIFKVQAKASGVALDNLPGWPKIENISGNLQLHGSRIEFDVSSADTFGTQLSKVKLHIADMAAPEAVLRGQIEADGATQQFLKVAAKYAGDDYGMVLQDNIKIAGNGRLLLKLDIPLSDAGPPRLAGNYEFIDNQLDPGPGMPSLNNINGILAFGDSKIRIENLTGRLLGGPLVINSADTPDGSFHLSAAGKINLDNLNEQTPSRNADSLQLWKRYLRGSTTWRASVRMRDKLVNMSIESSLQGITSNFPEPFSKTAADVVLTRVERKAMGPGRDEVTLSYDGRIAARFKRFQTDAGNYRMERGVVNFGTATMPSSAKAGLTVGGTLPLLDLDQWLGFLKQLNPEVESSPGLTGINVQVGALDFLGRRLNDVTLNASKENGSWYCGVIAEEINGNIMWDPSANGRVVARLNRLIIPSASPKPGIATQTRQQEKDLPALDVMADNFVFGEKQLGQLELIASPHARNWRIEKLHISNPDSSIAVKGVWQNQATPPRVQAALTLESNDIGKFLARLGHPDRVKRGSGRLEGSLSWYGSPQSLDYPTLSGSFKINARRGQFPKFEPGIGRLFGIFDLRTLPRRITLDFHDVFSEGFGFNDISGDIKIARGIAVTDDLKIEGPAAKVIMKGEINLEAETQNLQMLVTPSLGLATPVVGVASMIVSKTLQNATTSNEYNITGTWADPVVTKTSENRKDSAGQEQ
ncbi:YhdP family protein [Nitrosovibrio tenuis]|uniref:YhdP family protein n=1 Tax=Nitrosovibrio tenuis TaxID=1233 RepID=UPI001FDEF01E|nr:YhdP family protein [Nitrosovibrio tenuis]